MMHTTRLQLLSSATRRARRARRTTGRILVSALGFGMAYYFDTEHGQARRKQLQHWLQRTARSIDSVLTSEVGDPPPVFYPVWRDLRALEPDSPRPEPADTAAR
jgi:hypothetical protein